MDHLLYLCFCVVVRARISLSNTLMMSFLLYYLEMKLWVILSYGLAYFKVSTICKASPDSHFAFLHFFSMGMVLIPVPCTVS